MRKARVPAVVLCVLSIALAACSSSGKAATPTIPTNPNVGVAINSQGKKGQISAYIVAVNPTAHTITIDPMEFLTGAAAALEYQKINPSGGAGPTNDIAIVNAKIEHDAYTLAPDAVVRIVHTGNTNHSTPVQVSQSSLIGYSQLTSRPFWVTITGKTVTEIDEQFVGGAAG
jgi:hypothetical protein